jgi:predicted small lipoprotein YifL
MIRASLLIALLALAACGIDGDPIPPDGAAAPIASEGIDLTPEKGSI